MAATVAPQAAGARVVIFSLKDECPHCKKAKTLLEELGWPYQEISLTSYPEKRSDMLQLADRMTVPQIFIQGRHVGGAAELQELTEAGKLQAMYDAEPSELASDPRLRRPEYEPRGDAKLPEAPPEPEICIGGQRLAYPQLVQVLLEGVEVKDRSKHFGLKTIKRCFEGSAFLGFLRSKFGLASDEEATQAAQELLAAGVFSPADGAGAGFSDKELYRFQAHTASANSPLNGVRKWCSKDGCLIETPANPLGVVKRLKGQLSKILQPHMDGEGNIDYIAVAEDPAFLDFEHATAELQVVDLATLPEPVRRAFVINLYNMIIPHAFAKLGIPNGDLPRVAFFDGVCYEFASGVLLSLNDLENGVLRGNRAAPFHLKRPFASRPDLAKTVLPVDHRIHFALNCGAKSCPPVKWFTAEGIDEELRLVAMAWVEQDDNVKVDLERKRLSLSKICSWFSADFGANKVEIAKTLLQHARGNKKDQMEKLLQGDFALKHMPYDWSTNSKRAVPFTEICLSCLVR
eukprot:CAMPEP_0170270442 /NCGR_PEP_ID=MMETSP0116_2-20130129/35166_1 /TAXON_ID=400756 /ORGANISM="Durinskia baltica, Strain CSIRO CS-38" /LENGTH=516 /DNA_ID=CAMNT_0010521635 /DNA_START=42 /DNA_END=1592 /DNA_ORIENTATION=-